MMTGAPPRIPVGCGAYVSFHPSLGSVTAFERQAPHGLPSYFSMPQISRSGGPNFLGGKYAPFVVANDPNSDKFQVRDVELPRELSNDHFQSRRDLRSLVDRLPRYTDPRVSDPVLAYDQNFQQGIDLVMTPEAQRAFDIHEEPDKFAMSMGAIASASALF